MEPGASLGVLDLTCTTDALPSATRGRCAGLIAASLGGFLLTILIRFRDQSSDHSDRRSLSRCHQQSREALANRATENAGFEGMIGRPFDARSKRAIPE